MWSWKPIGPNIEPSPRRVSRTGSSSVPRAPCARRAHRRGATQAERKNLRRALQAKDRSRRIKARRRSVFCVCASRRRQMIGSGDRRISPVRRGESPCEACACTALRSHRRIAHAESSKKNLRAICGSSIALPVPKKPPQEGTPGSRRCSTTQRSWRCSARCATLEPPRAAHGCRAERCAATGGPGALSGRATSRPLHGCSRAGSLCDQTDAVAEPFIDSRRATLSDDR